MAPDESTANAVITSQSFSDVVSDRAPAATVKSSLAPVLVVDDNPSKRLALKAVLQPLGYPVVEADSGRAALRCVMAQDFAVILLDVCMPDMDGFETAALIRQRQQSELTPIIFITAFGSDEIKNTHRYAEGPVDFIFAPVEPDALRSKVSALAQLFMKAASLATQAADVQTVADQLRRLTDAAPIGIFQTDAEHRYVYTNPRWSEITGVSAEEAAGRRWDTIVGLEQLAEVRAELAEGTMGRREFCHRFEIPRVGLTSQVVVLDSVIIPDTHGGISGSVGTLADVTAEVRAEEAMSRARDEATESSRLKSDFLANMSHEIRTPMNGVIGMTDLLLETGLDARQREYAQTVRNSSEALLIIINDILDFSKIEAGKLEIEDIEFSLRTVIDEVVDLLAGSAQTKGLELVAVTANCVPAMVSGDPGRLRQVLTNFLGNAIKFTQTGEVVLRVSHEISGGESVVRFEVSDTGDGIASDKLAAIFQPFVQANMSTSRKYGGTGLGLAISSQLVALMGGDCGVSSVLGVGSTFWFTIRVHTGPTGASCDLLPNADMAGVRALVADDNAMQRSVLSEYLTEWGMTVTTADSGPAALETMRTASNEGRPFAVALLDQSMPGVDGLALRKAVEDDPALAARLVLMRASCQGGDFADAVEPGGCTYLSKPVHREDLLACMRVALGLSVAGFVAAEATILRSPVASRPETGRLLVAEDNLINQKVVVAMLSTAGYCVDTVLNGAEAVQAAANGAYDAILMDCQMPVLSGYEATVAIRAQEGCGRRTPIIALTASARREDRERCLAGGMDDYLAKPLSKDALMAMLGRFLKNLPVAAAALSGVRHASASEITLDPVVFEELRVLEEAGEESFLTELVGRFVEDTEQRLVQLRQAVAVGDAPAVGRIAHAIRGSVVQLGGQRLVSSCSRLEEKAEAGCLDTDLEEVETDYQELRRTLREQVSSDARQRLGPLMRDVATWKRTESDIHAETVTDRSNETNTLPASRAPLGNILLAEDNQVSQLVAKAMLEKLGFHVDAVANGTEAVRAAIPTSYQAILMDCQTPLLDGYQATREIRRLQGAFRRTPIIAVSASPVKTAKQRCLTAGMDDVIAKPLTLTTLAEVLARWIPDGPGPIIALDPVEALPTTYDSPDHANDPARPVLDVQVLDRLDRLGKAAGEDLIGQLASLFLADAHLQVIAMRQALKSTDFATTFRSAHTLSGASANLGATELARLCDTLATNANVSDIVDARALLEAIEGELGQVRLALASRSSTP